MPRNLFLLTFFLEFLSSCYSQTITGTYLYQDLFSTSSSGFSTEVASWGKSGSTSPFYSLCNSVPILGGYGIGGTFTRSYSSLPSHAAVMFSMSIYILDDWIYGDSLTINVEGFSFTLNQIGRSGSTSPYSANICGNPSYKDMGILKVRGQIFHSTNSLTITFTQSLTQGNTLESWGVRDVSFRFLTSSSGVFNAACFITPSGTSASNPCSCNNFNQFSGSGCNTCSSVCQGCIATSTTCLYCSVKYYFSGTSCVSCPSNCDYCSSSTICTQCSSGFYLLSNGQCSSTCPTPMTINAITNTCTSPCSTGQYLYWDGSCAASCPTPLTIVTIGTNTLCNYTCLTTQFLYWDGSCGSTCASPLPSSVIVSRNLCNFPCSAPTSFLMTNQTCSSTCTSPFYQTIIKTKTICNNPCAAGLYYFQNASCLSSCPAPYITINISSVLYCNRPCTSGYFYYQDASCRTTCSSPYQNITINLISYCNSPCQASNYYYDNSSCLSSCPSPFSSSNDGITNFCRCAPATPYYIPSVGICNATCNSNYLSILQGNMQECIPSSSNCTGYYLFNSSCVLTCNAPFTSRTVNSVNYCDFPCPATQYYSYQGICIANCSGFYIASTFGVESYCNPPCTQSQYILDTGICNSTCHPLFTSTIDSGYHFCTTPCTDPGFPYILTDGNCAANCSTPLIITLDNGYSFCTTPCNDPAYPYVLRNGSCIANCSSPWFVNTNYPYPMCDTKCNNSEYLTTSGGCSSTCNDPFTSISDMLYLYCDSPCRGSTPYMKFDTKTCTAACNPPYMLDPISGISQCIFMPAPVTTATQVSTATTSATSASASIRGSVGAAGGGGASAFGLVTMNRFLYYTRYLQINYPNNLREYYIQANSTAYPSLGISIPQDGLEFPPYRPIPPAFEGWGLNSSFIANYWQTFSTILITLGIGFVLWMLQKFFKLKKKKELAFFFERLMYIFRWNFALIQFCTGYDSIMLYASCEFRTYSLDDTISIISFACAILCVFLSFVFLVLTYYLAKKQYQVKHIRRVISPMGDAASMKDITDEDLNPVKIFMKNWEGFHILFGGYKDNTTFARGFIFFFMIRNILWILTLAILYDHPLVQISIMCFLSYFMLVMMLINRPFINLVSRFEIPCAEAIISFVNTNILVLAIMDYNGTDDPDTRTTIGSIIIYGFIVFGINAFVCMGFYFLVGFYQGYRRYKQMKASGSLSIISLITIPFVSYGMDFDEFEASNNKPIKLSIQRDPKTKELTIVKKRTFFPLFRLFRKRDKTISIGSTTEGERTSVKNMSTIEQHSSRDAFHKTILLKGLQARRIQSNQIAPAPLDFEKMRTDTESAEPLNTFKSDVVFNIEPMDMPKSPRIIEDHRRTDTYDIEDKDDRDIMMSPKEDIPIGTLKLPASSFRLQHNPNSSFYSVRVEKGSMSDREQIPNSAEVSDDDIPASQRLDRVVATPMNGKPGIKSNFAKNTNFISHSAEVSDDDISNSQRLDRMMATPMNGKVIQKSTFLMNPNNPNFSSVFSNFAAKYENQSNMSVESIQSNQSTQNVTRLNRNNFTFKMERKGKLQVHIRRQDSEQNDLMNDDKPESSMNVNRANDDLQDIDDL